MRFRTKLMLSFTAVLLLAMAANWFVVANRTRASVLDQAIQRATALGALIDAGSRYANWLRTRGEELVGSQMVVQAALTAHLVDVAENYGGLTPEEIRARLKDVAARTTVDEFWITDESGRAYLRNHEDIEFTFPDVPTERGQGYAFRRLLASREEAMIQDAMPRELDGEVFKYAGVSGIDRSRIVQVGHNAQSLAELTAGMHPGDLLHYAVSGHTDIMRVTVLRPDGTVEVDALPSAQPAREGGLVGEGALETMRAAFAKGEPAWRLDGDTLLVGYPRTDENGHSALIVYFDARGIRATTLHVMGYMSLASIGILLVGAYMAARISRRIADPVQRLAEEAARIGRGDLDRPVEVRAGGEVGLLANALNEMVAALKLHMQRLADETAIREHMETEVRIAAAVQSAILPKQLPCRAGVEVAAYSKPARVVGGDFFDVAELPGGRLVIVLGDASGKGLPAALFGTQCLSMLRAQALGLGIAEPTAVLNTVNRLLLATCRTEDLFATLFFGIVDPIEGTLTYACAGHPPHLVAKPGRAVVENCAGALPLGILDEFAAEEQVVSMSGGETLLLYTDGLPDAADQQGEVFGMQRVLACLEHADDLRPEALIAHVKGEVDRFVGEKEASDDMTLLAVRIAASA